MTKRPAIRRLESGLDVGLRRDFRLGDSGTENAEAGAKRPERIGDEGIWFGFMFLLHHPIRIGSRRGVENTTLSL